MCVFYCTLVSVILVTILHCFVTNERSQATWKQTLPHGCQTLKPLRGHILLCSRVVYKILIAGKYLMLFLRSIFKSQLVARGHVILGIVILKKGLDSTQLLISLYETDGGLV